MTPIPVLDQLFPSLTEIVEPAAKRKIWKFRQKGDEVPVKAVGITAGHEQRVDRVVDRQKDRKGTKHLHLGCGGDSGKI